ncbi:MAG TPA: zinc-ribbon domain-containing protein [Bacilli bacterium]|nr:zinc-ribbon domain-containing protein [Bacilli bacterium]
MKKNSLFKILGITFLVAVILTWVFKTASYSGEISLGDRAQLGLYDMIQYVFYSFRFFSGIMVFVLLTGALYGVLGATGVYERFIEAIANKFKKRKELVLVAIIAILAILSSFVGLEFAMFAFFPFLISLIMAMGYDKIVAVGATLGGTIVGMIGSLYSASMFSNVNSTLSLNYATETLMKCILLILGIGLLVLFTMLYVRKGKKAKKQSSPALVKEDSSKKAELIKCKECGKKIDDKSKICPHCGIKIINDGVKEKKDKNKKTPLWPLIVVFSLVLVIMIIGSFDWSGAAGITWFQDIYTKIMNVKIGGFAIFSKIFGNFPAFGTWGIDSYGYASFDAYAILIALASILIAIIYKVKFSDYLKSMLDGAKKALLPALLIAVAYAILIITVYNPVFLNISNFFLTITEKFNVLTTSFAIMINSIFNVEIGYFAQNELTFISGIFADSTIYPLIGMMFTSLFSLMSLIMPTGLLLIATLSYTDTSYLDWIKYIWKVFVGILVVCLILFTLMYLI